MAQANPIDYFAIRNTIATYCIALDTKDFQLLRHVFVEDVDAVYPFWQIKGVQNVADAIQKRLSPTTTQHALTTQIIEIAEDGNDAQVTTYFTGTHFGQGRWKGQQVTAWGRYLDTLVLTDDKDCLPGASGKWLISKRVVEFMSRLGEEGVMNGEDG
ncbi:hypothetical protein DOTSEDRAFT_57502 [Dothistroma septosporum NZE10]|uniref:SnoaL-like domain-containing protein n=1 Tax=Dothistroma septosporum (strain NZE10 / CBS 128990) TaxID=675120 RepID=N1PC81_DOTSN|nr:hypothetical protein DOTSEDRAFT_57502 [Dothistroma septosporum NZE10]